MVEHTKNDPADPLLQEARPSLERPDEVAALKGWLQRIGGRAHEYGCASRAMRGATCSCGLADLLLERSAPVAAAPASSGRWTATWNMKFGAAIWYDGRIMFRVVAGIEDSRITLDDPIPQWQKCVVAIIERMNQPAADPLSVSGTTPARSGLCTCWLGDPTNPTYGNSDERRACAIHGDLPTLRQLAKEATNGWACYARTNREHDEIARLHAAIDAVPKVGEAEGTTPDLREQILRDVAAAVRASADHTQWFPALAKLLNYVEKAASSSSPAPSESKQ